ncbi:MAG: hypothetical protein ACP5N9_03820 [Candidatus Bilamarchaeum sp.]|jgi:hypothetical protein
MADEFSGVGIAVILVSASIVLSGIMIGLGRAFNYKKIEHFGYEELVQSVINAAIIGSFAAIISLVSDLSSNLINSSCSGNIVDQLLCNYNISRIALFTFSGELLKIANIVGYYQKLALDFGAFSIEPFGNLNSISGVFSSQLLLSSLLLTIQSLNIQIAIFIKQNALGLLFPLGLLLRSFFATRRVGGFLIAIAIGLFIFYPSFIMIFQNPSPALDNSSSLMRSFSNNSIYAPIPIIDLNNNYAIAAKLDLMSGRCSMNFSNNSNCSRLNETMNLTAYNITNVSNTTIDFSGDLTVISGSNEDVLGKMLMYSLLAPIFSIIISMIFVRELGGLLGNEIGLKTFVAI